MNNHHDDPQFDLSTGSTIPLLVAPDGKLLIAPTVYIAASVELQRFDAAPLTAFTATKETDCGAEKDGRIPPGCGTFCTDLRAAAQAGS
ncbi:hypothetical protein K3557_09465 [Leisingera sp. M523]|nr:hypothetical protein [Leisingera sp. M523]UWQ30733.1 hypothetical protein K3557_09465 [Leisingera sp. M523]